MGARDRGGGVTLSTITRVIVPGALESWRFPACLDEFWWARYAPGPLLAVPLTPVGDPAANGVKMPQAGVVLPDGLGPPRLSWQRPFPSVPHAGAHPRPLRHACPTVCKLLLRRADS